MTIRDDGRACGALWHHDSGDSDHGLWWSRNPYARRARLDERTPCSDCKPVGTKTAARR